MSTTLYTDAMLVNEGSISRGWLLTDGERISTLGQGDVPVGITADTVRDCSGLYLLPGVIDVHVHFRDPGLTEKGDISTESRAAVAGGVTSYFDMPNTRPATVTRRDVDDKLARAAAVSEANYAFFIGATDSNLDELLAADYTRVPGIKLFLGSSTGNMLVDDESALERLFAEAPAIIAVHAEDEAVNRAARERLQAEYPEGIPVELHPELRPAKACVEATRHALALAERHGARLHICHVSTADELQLIAEAKRRGVRVTAETAPQYLLWDAADFLSKGARIKCNPSIKQASDRLALLRALLPGGPIDLIATDHAPHLLSQKQGDALTAVSGMPMVQFSLPVMLDLFDSEPELEGQSISRVAELMCHAPARVFGVKDRGFLRQGAYADLTLVERCPGGWKVSDSDVVSRCGWTPLEGMTLGWRVVDTVVSGGTGASPLAFSL
ncbi:MAG: amidohydrolase family protein [Bacteroides sp.]|nr:amidohydrolase family protein [Bacteroides sp.]MBD5332888.1 amidohydrolase family protein [Bacteroides sp.]